MSISYHAPHPTDQFSQTRHDNAASLQRELDWCVQVMDARLEQYFAADEDPKSRQDIRDVIPPVHEAADSEFAKVVSEWNLTFDERLVLAIALMPHLRPQALDLFFLQNNTLGRSYTEFGGWKGKAHGGFLPTCETAVWVLAGNDLARRLAVLALFDQGHRLLKQRVLRLEHEGGGEPFCSGAIHVTTEYLARFTTGEVHKPDFSAQFPAKLVTTPLEWTDLVLEPDVREDLGNIEAWIHHSRTLMDDWGMAKNVKPGYRCLFYGPPGTGKTLTATLIGKSTGKDVYRIDLSMVLSKFIGETEKNLSGVFDQAENKNWILFFDEADALFGKRTSTSSSNDRFANQEVSYLLQRIEDFPGVVILASNLKSNIDEAFSRRFQSVIYFPMPEPEQRLELWKGLFPVPSILADDVRFPELADEYELAGGSLTNVARYAALSALRDGRRQIKQEDLVAGVRKELQKEGRTL